MSQGTLSRRFGVPTTIIAALSLVLAACGGGDSSEQPAAQGPSFLPASLTGPAPESVGIGDGGGSNIVFLPLFIGQGLGYYNEVAQRFNTKIEFHQYGGGTLAEPAFLGGTDQFMAISTQSYLPVVLQGKDQVAVLNWAEGLGIEVVAGSKNKDSRGTDITKFKGVKWCQTGPVGPSNQVIKLLSGLNGLGVQDADIVSVGSVAAFPTALQAGRCDVASEDLLSRANQELKGIGYDIYSTSDPVQNRQLAGAQLLVPLTTSKAFADKYPQLTQAIVDATMHAITFIQQNIDKPDVLFNSLPPDVKKAYTPDVFAQAWKVLAKAFDPSYTNGAFSADQISDTIALQQATNSIPADAKVDPSKAFTNQFALQAYPDLGLTPAGTLPPANAIGTSIGQPTPEAARAIATLSGR